MQRNAVRLPLFVFLPRLFSRPLARHEREVFMYVEQIFSTHLTRLEIVSSAGSCNSITRDFAHVA